MIKSLWHEIPKQLRASAMAAIILFVVVSIIAGFVKNPAFGVQTAIAGGFSVILFCGYVIWTGRVMLSTKNMMQDAEEKKEIASSALLRIQIGSLVKFLALSVVIVVLVVAFNFDVIATIIGVSVIYAPLAIVPLFVKPDPEQAETLEVKCQSDASKVVD